MDNIIEGVRILTQEEVLIKIHGGIGGIFLLAICVAVGIICIFNFVMDIVDFKKIDFSCFFILIISVFCTICLVKDYNKPNEYRTEYMVEVSDEASFNEFYHKYKVIEDKGNNVYIVYEKEQLS